MYVQYRRRSIGMVSNDLAIFVSLKNGKQKPDRCNLQNILFEDDRQICGSRMAGVLLLRGMWGQGHTRSSSSSGQVQKLTK